MGAKKKQVVESQESVETQELDEEETQESTFSGTVSSREDTIQETEEDTQIEVCFPTLYVWLRLLNICYRHN